MAILEDEVWVVLNGANLNYYENLGYEIPRDKDKWGKIRIPRGTKILVKIEDLTDGSKVEVTRICDECGNNSLKMRYVDVLTNRERGDGKDRCLYCGRKKGGNTQSNNIKYEQSFEFCAIRDNKEYLLKEFSGKNNRKPSKIGYQSNRTFIWNCLNCNSEYPMRLNNRTSINNNGCPYCSGQKVNQTNCLGTTHPEIIKLLTNSEDALKYTHGSGSKIKFTCPDCGNTDRKIISNVVRHGFSCSKCGDGLSYPEKFMTNLLWQLKLNFKSQKIFNWSENKRYDFYIPSLNCIIETHGAQHYQDKTFKHLGGRTLSEEQENDKFKKELAMDNGIKHYTVIDCSMSEPNFIKSKIFESEISNLFDLCLINWNKCNEFACCSLVKVVCDIYKKEPISTVKLGKLVGLERSTVCKYLKLGSKIGWCRYDGKEVNRQLAKSIAGHNAIKIVQLSFDGEFIREWNSASEIERETGICKQSILKICRGELNQSQGFRFMIKEEYEKNGVAPNKDKRPKVIQLSKNGEFIKEHKNANEANRYLGKVKTAVASINKCCKGESRMAYGFKWMYKEDYEKLIDETFEIQKEEVFV